MHSIPSFFSYFNRLSRSGQLRFKRLFLAVSTPLTYHAALSQIHKYLPALKENREQLSEPPSPLSGLSVFGLCYEINGNVLMEQASFTLSPGEKCLLYGDNGSGKSTLLALLMGELTPSEGSITLDGNSVSSNAAYFRNSIAYCPQAAPVLRCTPADLFENALHKQSNLSGQLLCEYAGKLCLNKEDMEKPIDQLSGGTQKKVVLCMALAKQAPLLLLDEPEAMLDQKAVESLLQILRSQERTMLIVTHHHIYEGIVDSLLTFKNRQLLKSSSAANVR